MSSPTPFAGDGASYVIRWRGKQEGPYSAAVIEAKLAANQIGLLHEIYDEGEWKSIRSFLELRAVRARHRLEREAEIKREAEAERAAAERVDAAPRQATIPQRVEPPPRTSARPDWLLLTTAGCLAATIVLLILVATGVVGHKDTDAQLADVAKKYESAVGVVIIYDADKSGHVTSAHTEATAWAVGDRLFVSNGHVTEPVQEALDKGGGAVIILNKNPERKFNVVKVRTHPKYSRQAYDSAGNLSTAAPAYDIGLLTVDTNVPVKFIIAPRSELEELDSGHRIAYLGFPMENLANGGVDVAYPVANMQSGIVTRTTDFYLSKATFENRLLISMNLAVAGGASGSPVFNAKGHVVGVLSAGNVSLATDPYTHKVERISSTVENFAQRIDILRDIYEDYP